jgi:membrane protein DedA with SNARE-associated domain
LAIIELLDPIVQFIVSLISNIGYPGIFALMVLESALIPIPSEVIMTFSGFLVADGKLGFVGAILAGSLGNLVGSIATYYLGKKFGREFLIKYGRFFLFKEHHLEVTEQLFRKHGAKISFFGRLLPAIRTYVSLPIGMANTNFKKFLIYTFVGSLIWNALLVYAGMQLGANWKNIEKYSTLLDIAAVIAIAVFIIWFIVNSSKKRRIGNKANIAKAPNDKKRNDENVE